MTGTGAVGLMAIFFSDFATIFFLGLLGDLQLLAAVGLRQRHHVLHDLGRHRHGHRRHRPGAPALGARDVPRARRLATHALLFAGGASALMVAALWFALPVLLGWLGAERSLAGPGARLPAHRAAIAAAAGARHVRLRRTAFGRRSAARDVHHPDRRRDRDALDAVLILWLGLGIHGAGIAAFISHVGIMAVGWWGVVHVHGLLAKPDWRVFPYDVRLIARFAIPAVLPNLATPAGGAYVTVAMSQFSDSAVAGWAVIGRIIPIAFGTIFSLSGSIGAIIGQNLGARQFERVRATLNGGLTFAATFYGSPGWSSRFAAPVLVQLFNASGEAARLILFFCRWLAPLFAFFGTLFVCNAACNTLGRPHYATALNWGRATLGTVPFVTLGAHWGAEGVLAGHMAGGIAFGARGGRSSFSA